MKASVSLKKKKKTSLESLTSRMEREGDRRSGLDDKTEELDLSTKERDKFQTTHYRACRISGLP